MEQQCWWVRGCAPVAYRDCRALSPVSRVPQAAVFVDIFRCAEDWLRCLHVSPAASPGLAVPAGCCSPAVSPALRWSTAVTAVLFWREGMAGCSGCWESPLAGCAVLLSQPSELPLGWWVYSSWESFLGVQATWSIGYFFSFFFFHSLYLPNLLNNFSLDRVSGCSCALQFAFMLLGLLTELFQNFL